MMLSKFLEIVKYLLNDLPKIDYRAISSFLFASSWLGWVMDQSQVGMRDLILRLKSRNINIDLSTFSKESKNRGHQVFEKIGCASNECGFDKVRNEELSQLSNGM